MQKFIFILFIQTIHQCFATDLTCGDLKVVYNDNCECADDSSSSFCVNNGFQTYGSVTHIADWQRVGIGTETPHNSAALDITSTTNGFLMPRMTEDQRGAIVVPATGLMIYQLNGEPGFYFFDGGDWRRLSTAQPTYTINTFYAELGGYVIAVRDGGKHGLVVAMQDQGYSSWYGANDLLSDADNHDDNGAKFMDWRLPTKRELNLVYNQKLNIGGFSPINYWSSTEYLYGYAWTQYFANSHQSDVGKTSFNHVRSVRAF